MVISDKFKHSDTVFKYFIGYKDDSIVRPLCIILSQINGYIKYFDNGAKNMSFMIEDDINEIWNKIKNTLKIKLHSVHVYDDKYIKVTVKGVGVMV